MKTIYHCAETGRFYWNDKDDSSYIEPVFDDNAIVYFDVWHVEQGKGIPTLDSHCDTFKDAMFQLEMVST